MGMYTELLLKCSIKEDIPQEVKDVICFLFQDGDIPNTIPNHPFFSCSRWQFIGKSCSFYHHPESVCSVYKERLFSRSDLKNYDGEIEHFLDWFSPYVEYDGCIGWKWYEESDKPTLVFVENGKVRYE